MESGSRDKKHKIATDGTIEIDIDETIVKLVEEVLNRHRHHAAKASLNFFSRRWSKRPSFSHAHLWLVLFEIDVNFRRVYEN
jgi:hypothetical protein